MEGEILSVSQLRDYVNQTLDYAYPAVVVQGEVSSFKINQGKWIFFDLKDAETTVSCFMTKYQLNTILEDGMLVRVTASPNLTKWGKFSLTVKAVELAGEGSVKRAFEKLKAQFEAEGLFAQERKRLLPAYPAKIGLITSQEAAAYNDFISIVSDRWPLLTVEHVHVHVQGVQAPTDVAQALKQLNADRPDLEVLVVIRGGGSLEDLQAFNDERIVRAVYGSGIPTIVAIGHEDDVSLAELAADVRAATPSDAARRLTPDHTVIRRVLDESIAKQGNRVTAIISQASLTIARTTTIFERVERRAEASLHQIQRDLNRALEQHVIRLQQTLELAVRTVHAADPARLLSRGYAIVRQGKTIISNVSQLVGDQEIVVQLHQGTVHATVLSQTTASGQRKEKTPTYELKSIKQRRQTRLISKVDQTQLELS